MYNILFFLFFLYLIYNLYNYFNNNNIKFLGGSNDSDTDSIEDLDSCIDEVMKLAKIGKICDPDHSDYNDGDEFNDAINLCMNTNFNDNEDKKKIKKSIKNGLFYKLKQNELKTCDKKPWVTTKEQCIEAINSKVKQGIVCKDDKYVKLGLEACNTYSEPKILRMGDEGKILYQLRDRIFKKKIPTCMNKTVSCTNLTENECKNETFSKRCKYDINKCKPLFFNNYDEAFEFLKEINITRKQKKKIIDLIYNNQLDKANYFTELYIQKLLKVQVPKKLNCKNQSEFISNIKNIKPNEQSVFKNLCKTKKGRNNINRIFSSIIKT